MEEKLTDLKRKIDLYKPIVIALSIVFSASTIGLIISLCTAAATKMSIPCYIIVMAVSFTCLVISLVLLVSCANKYKSIKKTKE